MNRQSTPHRRRRPTTTIAILSFLSLVLSASASWGQKRHHFAHQMQLSKSPKRYDTSHPIINEKSSQAAATAIYAEVLLHRLRGGDETNDELAVEEDDNDSISNDVSVTSSEPITVDNSVVETDNEEADEDDTADDNINIEAVNSQEEGSLEEVEEQIIDDDDETNNIDDNAAAVLATEEVEETATANASDQADVDEENDQVEEETVELVEEASDDEKDEETEESASQPSISDIMANTTPASESESNTDNDYDDDDNDAYDETDSSTDEETTTTTTTSSPPDTYEVQSNELRTSASDKRAMAKTHHDNGNLKDAAIAFREAAMLLDEAMEALSQSSLMNDNETKEEEEGNIAVERATCRLHEALCLLKDGRPGDCVEACTDVLEDDVTVVPLDNDESENGDDDGADPTQQAAVVKIIPATTTGTGTANKPAIPAQIRARAHHRRAKARLALGDLDGALEDARSAAFMGDRNAVQFYGRLMREGSATTSGAELSPSSPMGMGGGSNPFLDGMLGGMGGNANPFMPSPGAGSSSDFSSSLLSSLLTGSSGSGSGGGGNPFGLMGELLSPPEESSTGSSKRRRGKAKKDSLAKSVLKNIMKRIEDEETQETICGYLQSTNKQQIMQFSTMAGVPIKEETAQRLSGLANGITPKGIRKGVRRVKRGLKVVKTGRKILKVIDKYKPVIIVAVLLYWVRSAVLEPYPISKKKKLAQQAALGLLIMPTQKSALANNVRGALSKVFMSPAEADAGSVEDDSSSSGIEEELEKLQHQLTLIEAIEERNKAQIYSFIDEEDQWNSMEEWEQELLSSKEALTQRMEQMTEELVLMFMGEKAKNG